ncbi:MAG: 30S ribosomal protein S27ae [Candidatus Bathyarchaeia archaeon]|jgi:small subunit ribosomal protein S27Ae|nr:30S ribosomal protein S27ae [Candidatus Bathyarchaeota archaeon A05DMB-4]
MSKKEKAENPAKETKEPKEEKPIEAPEAPTEAEAPVAKKPAKGKIKRKKRIGKKIYTLYKIDGETITRVRPFCERCGPGYFMADHGNRFACGHCGFTRYKVAEPAE